MRILKIMLIVLVLCVVSALSISCGSESEATDVAGEQVAAVQRGDLTIDITAVGNLEFSHREELTFESDGTVEEVLVEVGDYVEGGQVLAELDNASIISLQKAVVQAKIDLRDAESAEEAAVTLAELAVADARVALEAAREALEDTEYSELDIAQAELDVINAEIALDGAQDNLKRAKEKYKLNRSVPEREWDYEQKQKELVIAEFNFAEAEETLVEIIAGADPLEVEQKQKQLAVAQANLKEAEDELAGMLGVELKQSEVTSAQAALDEAIEKLEMATMVAPFAGIVTLVDVEVGETVNANQVVIELVDPDKFEAEVLVSEMDIENIRPGAQATIQVDAMSGVSLPAEVTNISPIATIQSGVVNYEVKVEIESLQAMIEERREVRQETMPDISSGELSEQMKQAIEEGRLTQEQVEEMMEQRQQGQVGQQGMPMMIPEDFQLREGLTVTVSIIVDERNDVLLVPNSAITSSGRQNYVKVVSADGVIEDRVVTTGISNWQYTEIVEGLSEGEQVVVPQGTITEPVTSQERPGGMRIPGMGGIGH